MRAIRSMRSILTTRITRLLLLVAGTLLKLGLLMQSCHRPRQGNELSRALRIANTLIDRGLVRLKVTWDKHVRACQFAVFTLVTGEAFNIKLRTIGQLKIQYQDLA